MDWVADIRGICTHPSGRKALMLHYILTTLLFAIGEFHLSTMKEN